MDVHADREESRTAMRLLEQIEKSFAPLKTRPCWSVQQGYGSNLTFEFGQPHLDIFEPQGYRERTITVHGAWHLWIHCCYWVIEEDSKLLAHCESDRQEIGEALSRIDGQILVQVAVDTNLRSTQFDFEWGVSLKTEPYEDLSEDGQPYESWMLFEPEGYVLTYRADSRYSYHPAEEAVEVWLSPDGSVN